MSGRLAGALALLVLLAFAPASAQAEFGFVPGSFHSASVDAGGQPDLRAGAHPHRLVSGFAFKTDGAGGVDGNAKDLVIEMPTGFVGNARSLPACPRGLFAAQMCPSDTQIGEIDATFVGLGPTTLPIYNVVPREDEVAEFGFVALVVPIRMVATVRTDSDYGLSIQLSDLPQSVPLSAGQITLWGIPADHPANGGAVRHALLTNPSRCDRLPVTVVRARSWEQPGTWITTEAPEAGMPTGCDALPFQAAVGLGLDTPAADTPSGLDVELTLPQEDDPDAIASAPLRSLAIQLPPGVTLSPAVAGGLTACTDEQLGAGSTSAPSCPASSKIGSAEILSPLTAPLIGSLYIGRPLPGDPYRLFVTANGPSFVVKLRGSLQADPATGQLTAVFGDLPELTFSRLSLHFKDGPRAPIATPAGCGIATGSATMAAHGSGATATVPTSIAIGTGAGGGPCPSTLPFTPQLVAGASPPIGGGDSALSVTVRRADGQQALDRIALTLPAGLTARLADVPPCPTAQAAAAACAPASRIGTVATEAGPGPSPFPLSGDAYLTGPFRGAPFGLAFVMHAQAGPFDLGTIVVLATLRIDPFDGSISVATQALPRVLAGVPLRLQTFALDVDRPGFMLNPTSCRTGEIAASIRSADATTVSQSTRFAVGGCRRLPFRPGVSLSLGPVRALRDGGHPELRIALRARAGEARLRSAAIRLPSMLTLNQTAVSAICSREQARDGRCPAESQVGTARAETPLLSRPLSGPVSVVQPSGNGQPDLWATLEGEGVRLSVRSTISLPRGKPMLSRFVELPDVPLSRFALTLDGGRRGALSAVAGFCRDGRPRPLVVRADLRSQSGGRRFTRVPVRARPACAR